MAAPLGRGRAGVTPTLNACPDAIYRNSNKQISWEVHIFEDIIQNCLIPHKDGEGPENGGTNRSRKFKRDCIKNRNKLEHQALKMTVGQVWFTSFNSIRHDLFSSLPLGKAESLLDNKSLEEIRKPPHI